MRYPDGKTPREEADDSMTMLVLAAVYALVCLFLIAAVAWVVFFR